MVFGLTQWFVSFVIFLIVLSIISWSAVHLGKKEENSTIAKVFNAYDHSLQKKSNLPASMIIPNSPLQLTQSTAALTLFTSEQGSEVPDTTEFYKIVQALSSTKTSTVKNMTSNITPATLVTNIVSNDTTTIVNNDTITIVNNDTTTIINNDTITVINNELSSIEMIEQHRTTQNTDTIIMTYNPTDKSVTLINNSQNMGSKGIKNSLPSQIIRSPTIHGVKFFDLDKLRQSNSYRSVGLDFTDFLHDEKNGTLNASIGFSFVRAVADTKNATRQTTTKLP